MQRRRTVRDFDPRPVPCAVIEACLEAAGTAPSGANQQPWHFVAVSDPEVKRRIRIAAEAEEREFYERRAPAESVGIASGILITALHTAGLATLTHTPSPMES
jgi:nitroreductase